MINILDRSARKPRSSAPGLIANHAGSLICGLLNPLKNKESDKNVAFSSDFRHGRENYLEKYDAIDSNRNDVGVLHDIHRKPFGPRPS